MQASILLFTHPNPAITSTCLQALQACTPEPHELLIVERGAQEVDDTVLEGAGKVQRLTMAGTASPGKCLNEALRHAQGDLLVLLDASARVCPNWLAGLSQAALSDPSNPAAGPVSNLALTNLEQVVAPDYGDLVEVDAFAEHRRIVYQRRTQATRVLDLFCLAITRPALEKVGPWDTELSHFLAQDYCLRLRLHKLGCQIALDVFVHRQHVSPPGWYPTEEDEERAFQQGLEDDHRRYTLKWEALQNRLHNK